MSTFRFLLLSQFGLLDKYIHLLIYDVKNLQGKNIANVVNQVNINDKSYVLALFNQAIENTSIVLQDDIRARIIA